MSILPLLIIICDYMSVSVSAWLKLCIFLCIKLFVVVVVVIVVVFHVLD